MGQLRHGSARTTAAVRGAIQQSQEIAQLAQRDDFTPNAEAQWKQRTQVHDAPIGPKPPRSTILTLEEEALRARVTSIRCCRWMTACRPCKPRGLT